MKRVKKMKFTAKEVDIMRRIKIRPVWRKECELTGDEVFCALMYVVDGGRFFRFDVFNSRQEVYDHCFDAPMTVTEVIEGNLYRQTLKEREKVNVALEGLKEVMAVAVDCNDGEWNPINETLAMKVVSTAETVVAKIEDM